MVYLDTSAFVKAVKDEPESEALRRDLGSRGAWIASALLKVEGVRACARAGQEATRRAEEGLRQVNLVAIDDPVLTRAALIAPPSLASGDAIHLVTALSMRSELEAFYTYDRRLADAARAAGLSVRSPR